MAIGNISDGELGSDVRAKLNLSIDQLNTYTGGQGTFTGAGSTSSTINTLFQNSSALASLTVLDDSSIVNYGGSGVTTNTAFGKQTLTGNTSGVENTGFGLQVLQDGTTGSANTGVGFGVLLVSNGNSNTGVGRTVLRFNTDGASNTGIGRQALYLNTIGSSNTAIGRDSMFSNTTGDKSVGVGSESGYYETGSNKLFIDNARRASEADARVKALIYGVFASTVSAQRLSINGSIGIAGAATSTSTLNVSGLPTSSAGLVTGDVYNNSGVLTIV